MHRSGCIALRTERGPDPRPPPDRTGGSLFRRARKARPARRARERQGSREATPTRCPNVADALPASSHRAVRPSRVAPLPVQGPGDLQLLRRHLVGGDERAEGDPEQPHGRCGLPLERPLEQERQRAAHGRRIEGGATGCEPGSASRSRGSAPLTVSVQPAEPTRLEIDEQLRGQSIEHLEHRLSGDEVLAEGALAAHRLPDPARADRSVIDAAGGAIVVLVALAELARELLPRPGAQVRPGAGCRARACAPSVTPPDAVDGADRQRRDEGLAVGRQYPVQAIGLVEIGGDLREGTCCRTPPAEAISPVRSRTRRLISRAIATADPPNAPRAALAVTSR